MMMLQRPMPAGALPPLSHVVVIVLLIAIVEFFGVWYLVRRKGRGK
jgi:hypothetical protein